MLTGPTVLEIVHEFSTLFQGKMSFVVTCSESVDARLETQIIVSMNTSGLARLDRDGDNSSIVSLQKQQHETCMSRAIHLDDFDIGSICVTH